MFCIFSILISKSVIYYAKTKKLLLIILIKLVDIINKIMNITNYKITASKIFNLLAKRYS